MTEQEAIKEHIKECNHRIEIIENAIENKVIDANSDAKHNIEVMKRAIIALEEIQQYRAIGTVEECREAVEKQQAKKPNLEGDGYADGHMVYDTWICPCCEISYEVDYDDYKYCPDCGQRIDWSE